MAEDEPAVWRPRRSAFVAWEARYLYGSLGGRSSDNDVETLSSVRGERNAAVGRPRRLSLHGSVRSKWFGIPAVWSNGKDAIEKDDGQPFAVCGPRGLPQAGHTNRLTRLRFKSKCGGSNQGACRKRPLHAPTAFTM
jgi:hypothetical protein